MLGRCHKASEQQRIEAVTSARMDVMRAKFEMLVWSRDQFVREGTQKGCGNAKDCVHCRTPEYHLGTARIKSLSPHWALQFDRSVPSFCYT